MVTNQGKIIGAGSWLDVWEPEAEAEANCAGALRADPIFKALSSLIGAQHAAAALEAVVFKGQPAYRSQVVYQGEQGLHAWA